MKKKTKTHQEIIEEYIKVKGFKMSKKIQEGSSSIFGYYTPPVYDSRTVYSLKDISKLTSEGFVTAEDAGIVLWNAFVNN